MANVKYFHGETELTGIYGMPRGEFAGKFPGVAGRSWDSFSKLVGSPVGEVPEYDHAAKRWARTILPVERKITFKDRPSLHECDARCMNATGRTMNCECSCGGKNHGRGSFRCD